jgi:excisionase family DNA binding protein
MITVAEAANRVGRNPETVRRWIRSGRLPAQRVRGRHVIDERELGAVIDEIYPSLPLPDEWRKMDNGEPAPNWVALVRRSRRGR